MYYKKKSYISKTGIFWAFCKYFEGISMLEAAERVDLRFGGYEDAGELGAARTEPSRRY